MRKPHKEIKDRALIDRLLDTVHVGHLGTIGADGYPMIKPLNFARVDGALYFHSACQGEKIDHIERDGRVCFEVAEPVALIRARKNPCDCEYLYRSVIIKGRAAIVTDDAERMAALNAMMRKYQPEGGWGQYTPDRLCRTCVVRITPEETVGKEDLGKPELREQALRAIESGAALPVIIEWPDV